MLAAILGLAGRRRLHDGRGVAFVHCAAEGHFDWEFLKRHQNTQNSASASV